jgi:DNA-binding response OmpR family regulator
MSAARILVVDDEPAHAELIAVLLRREGYEVEVASEPGVALAAVPARPPTLLILDLMIPPVDGFAAIADLQRNPQTTSLPIVLTSACAEASLRQRGPLPVGTVYLQKPFHIAELLGAVKTALRPRTE